jgi:predicted dehydrogenase
MGVPSYTDLSTMLEKADFQLLVNITSVPSHFSVSLAGLRSGRHVYTQKPMTTTVEEATTLIEEAEKRGLKLVAEDAGPLLPSNQAIRRLLDEGAIGKVVWARATCTHWGPATIDNWPTNPEWFYKQGAGPLRDVGIERLHGLTSFFGPARRVTSMSGISQPEVIVRGGPCKGNKIRVDEDDVTLLTIDFGDVFALLDTAWVNYRATHVPPLEIYGQKGVISHLGGSHPKARGRDFAIELYRDHPNHGIRGWTSVEVIPPALLNPPPAVTGLVHAFECIAEDKRPVLSGEHARHCIDIIEKAFVAARTGVTQRIETTF